MSFGHLDYGLPNVFADGVIDGQHHTMPPWFDVCPMLGIAAFKGGEGYVFTRRKRRSCLARLDEVGENLTGLRLSRFLGDFLLVKCFFFLTLMRPEGPSGQHRQAKWAYRRKLLSLGLDSYERDHWINTASFSTPAAFLTGPTGDSAPLPRAPPPEGRRSGGITAWWTFADAHPGRLNPLPGPSTGPVQKGRSAVGGQSRR